MTDFLRRLFTALIALWFTVLTVEPARLHACPMHGGLVADGAPSAPMHASHHAHGGHDDSTGGKGHTCSCLGSCTTAASPSAPVGASFEVRTIAAHSVGLPELVRPVVSPAHAIPFANGPPRA